MKKQTQKPTSATHDSQQANGARSTSVSKTASTLSNTKLLRALADAAKRDFWIRTSLPSLYGDGIKADLLEAARKKTVQHLIEVHTFKNYDWPEEAQPDQDGDVIWAGVVPILEDREYPVRLQMHPDTDAATLKRLLRKILKPKSLRFLEERSAEAAVRSALMTPICPEEKTYQRMNHKKPLKRPPHRSKRAICKASVISSGSKWTRARR
jgi:hypothetical protein